MLSIEEIITATEVGLVYGILALGIYITFQIINFPDLTCDGSFITGAAISSVTIKAGCSPFAALIFATAAGGLAGFCTGILNVRMKIEELMSGIIVAFMLYSVNLRIMGSSPNITLSDAVTVFSSGNPLLVIFVIVILIVVFFAFLLNTDFGLGLRSVGQNRQFALISGVNVDAMIIFGLVVSNALIGLSGAIFTQYQGFCDVSQGVGCLVVGLASVVIGENLLRNSGLKYGKSLYFPLCAVFCVVGSVIYRIFIAFAVNSDIFGFKTQDVNFITGLLIIFIMKMRKSCYK
jgi:putative ABC transport system permease protein